MLLGFSSEIIHLPPSTLHLVNIGRWKEGLLLKREQFLELSYSQLLEAVRLTG